jgi:hypothetical protein
MQLDLLRFCAALGRPRPGESSDVGPVEQAIAAGDWQAAYDAVRRLSPGSNAALARVLFVALRLQEGGAPEAALDLLSPALEAHPQCAQLYWQTTQVLTELGAFEDALTALEILRQLPDGERFAKAA